MKCTQSEIYVTKGITSFFYLFSSIWQSRGRIILPPRSRAALQWTEKWKKSFWISSCFRLISVPLFVRVGRKLCRDICEWTHTYLNRGFWITSFFFLCASFAKKKELKTKLFFIPYKQKTENIICYFFFFCSWNENVKADWNIFRIINFSHFALGDSLKYSINTFISYRKYLQTNCKKFWKLYICCLVGEYFWKLSKVFVRVNLNKT